MSSFAAGYKISSWEAFEVNVIISKFGGVPGYASCYTTLPVRKSTSAATQDNSLGSQKLTTVALGGWRRFTPGRTC